MTEVHELMVVEGLCVGIVFWVAKYTQNRYYDNRRGRECQKAGL